MVRLSKEQREKLSAPEIARINHQQLREEWKRFGMQAVGVVSGAIAVAVTFNIATGAYSDSDSVNDSKGDPPATASPWHRQSHPVPTESGGVASPSATSARPQTPLQPVRSRHPSRAPSAHASAVSDEGTIAFSCEDGSPGPLKWSVVPVSGIKALDGTSVTMQLDGGDVDMYGNQFAGQVDATPADGVAGFESTVGSDRILRLHLGATAVTAELRGDGGIAGTAQCLPS